MKKFKTALIGCGGAGTQHAAALSSHQASEFVAVCDLDPARAETLAQRHGVRAYSSYSELLERERPDVVNVATFETFHAVPACAALAAGAHVFCEKIMAHSLAAGREMLQMAKANGRVLGVNYNYRRIPSIQFLKEQIIEGDLRDPLMVTAETHAFCWHHTLDILCDLLGEPLQISARIRETPETRPGLWPDISELLYVPTEAAAATIEFASGASAHLFATLHVPLEQHLISLSIFSRGGMAHLDNIRIDQTSGTLTIGAGREIVETLPAPTLNETFGLSIHAFLDALAAGQPVPASGRDGYRVMMLEHAALLSSQQQQPIRLDFIEPAL